jgi:hypothetical protein
VALPLRQVRLDHAVLQLYDRGAALGLADVHTGILLVLVGTSADC